MGSGRWMMFRWCSLDGFRTRRTLRLSLALSSLVGAIGRAGLRKEVGLLRPGRATWPEGASAPNSTVMCRGLISLTRRCPRYFANRKRPRGWVSPPWIFAFPSEFWGNISHWYVFGVKESNGDNEKILSLLHDLENQGKTPFCMTFHISGCKHDANSILVSILTFSRSGI